MQNMVPPYGFPGQPMQAAQLASPWSLQPSVTPAPWPPVPAPISSVPGAETYSGETIFRFAMEQANQVVRYLGPTHTALLNEVSATLALDRNATHLLKPGQDQDAHMLLQLQCLAVRGSGYALTVVGRGVIIVTQGVEMSHV